MSVKIFDTMTTATPNFPLAYAEKINVKLQDGTEDNLQNLFDNKELGGGGDSSVTLTQQEYEALSEEQKLGWLYYTYDTKRIYKNGVQYGASDAEGIGYNNAKSGIQATTVQGAIDKVVEKVDGLISDTTSSTTSTWSSQKTSSKIAEVESVLNELENITRLTDFDEAIPEIGKNKIYYVNKIIGTYKCAQWRVESMYYDVSGAKQYRGVQKATSINGVDNIMLMREYYLDDNVMHWGAWQELATMDKVVKYPDWSNQQTISQTEITVDQDVYIELNQLSSSPIEALKINGKDVSVSDSQNELYSTRFSGYVKKGSFVSYPYLTDKNVVRVFPLV